MEFLLLYLELKLVKKRVSVRNIPLENSSVQKKTTDISLGPALHIFLTGSKNGRLW